MIVTDIKDGTLPSMKKVRLAEFNNCADLASVVDKKRYCERRLSRTNADWAGGTFEQYQNWSRYGDISYVDRAQKYVDQFVNLALRDYAPTMDYNVNVGILDYATAQAGDPMCMFGPTIDETDKSPVQVYIDGWTSMTIDPHVMINRGIAVLAFAMALSIYRPVQVKIVTGMKHMPSGYNVITSVPVPTAPMDLSIAAWMLASPTMFRMGNLNGLYEIVENTKPCGTPRLDNAGWQGTKMAQWMAERDGVNDVVFLPLMMDNGQWSDTAHGLEWVKKQLKRFMP